MESVGSRKGREDMPITVNFTNNIVGGIEMVKLDYGFDYFEGYTKISNSKAVLKIFETDFFNDIGITKVIQSASKTSDDASVRFYDTDDNPLIVVTGARTDVGLWSAWDIERLMDKAIDTWINDRLEILGTKFSDKLLGANKKDSIYGKSGDDKLFGEDGADLLVGGRGNDKLTGGSGGDVLKGGSGDDVLKGDGVKYSFNAGNDRLFGGAGEDILYGNAGSDTLDGGNGDDKLFGGDDNDTLNGGNGNDLLDGGKGKDILKGGAGNDVIKGGRPTYSFSGDSDQLFGGAGRDKLFGGAGNNRLNGGSGDDLLTGGKGVDTFVFKGRGSDADTITDFRNYETIEISGPVKFSDLTVSSINSGADALIEWGAASITLLGFAAHKIDASDFDFV